DPDNPKWWSCGPADGPLVRFKCSTLAAPMLGRLLRDGGAIQGSPAELDEFRRFINRTLPKKCPALARGMKVSVAAGHAKLTRYPAPTVKVEMLELPH